MPRGNKASRRQEISKKLNREIDASMAHFNPAFDSFHDEDYFGSPDNIMKVVEVVKEHIDGAMRLGCSVGGGIDQDEMMNPFSEGDCGIFVSKIRKHSAADRAGLEVGDKIIACNGRDITRVTHKEAIEMITNRLEPTVTLKVARNLVTEDPRLMMKRAAVEFRQSLPKTVS